MNYHFLTNEDLPELTKIFNLAFSDYSLDVNFSDKQLEIFFQERQVDLKRSLGVTANGEMIGFTFNGFGLWNNLETVYDACTGVVPDFRRQGIAENMFEFMIPQFQKQEIKQYLLEVITENEKALKLYDKLGFERTRKVSFLKAEKIFKGNLQLPKNLKISQVKEPDWNRLRLFGDGKPTWQTTIAAIEATKFEKVFLGAFWDDKCIGHVAFSKSRPVIAQFAVDKKHRQKGVGLALLTEMQRIIGEKKVNIVNLDIEMEETLTFFQNRGFREVVSQFEMIKKL